MNKSQLLVDHIKKIRPLINEATPKQKIKLIKLMKQALSEDIQKTQTSEIVQNTQEMLDYLEEK